MPNITLLDCRKSLANSPTCHEYKDTEHQLRFGRFTNSAFGKVWNFNKSPKNYDKVARKYNH